MILRDSQVVFDSVAHTYELKGKKLKGITQVIKNRLFPEEYANVPDSVLQKAAERGSKVHTALEFYDQYDMTTDCPELQGYIAEMDAHPFLRNHEESEYLVTDGKQYASAIDKVYRDGDGVILADIKTTYKLNTDYVAWQLSVYKFFFNILNPNIEVKAGYAIWLRGDKHKVVKVNLHSEDEVKKLLYTEEPMLAVQNDEGIPFNEDYLLQLKTKADEATAAFEAYKQYVADSMQKENITKVNGMKLMVTQRADTERMYFNSKKFGEEHPELFKEYQEPRVTKGGLSIKVL